MVDDMCSMCLVSSRFSPIAVSDAVLLLDKEASFLRNCGAASVGDCKRMLGFTNRVDKVI